MIYCKKPKNMGVYKDMEDVRTHKKELAEYITGFFVLLLLTVFPLILHDQYFDIVVVKYMFVYISVIAMTVLVLISLLLTGSLKYTKRKLRSVLEAPDRAMLFFVIACFISTILSDYLYESVWGNEGRYCGFFLIAIYGAMYFVITRKFRFSRFYVDAYLLFSMLVCLWGISDFFKLDLFGFKAILTPEDQLIFTSSLGNINTYTAYVALVSAISGIMFISAKESKRIIWYTLCFVISLFAIIMGVSDNAYLSLGALFAFVPYYAFKTRSGIKRYLCMIAIFATVIQCVAWCGTIMNGRVLEISGVFDVLANFRWFILLVVMLWLLFGLTCFMDRHNRNESIKPRARWIWSFFLLSVAVAVVAVLYDANTTDMPEKYGSLRNYLIFDDNWGTHRMYNWKLGLKNYKEFSLIHKVFGYGPETYGIITVGNNIQEMTLRYYEKFDNAHNEYLQYFITIGPVGLVAYLSVLISSGIHIIKKASNDCCVMALLFAVICYAAQATVNIATPIVNPFLWLFISMGIAACRNKELRTEDEG